MTKQASPLRARNRLSLAASSNIPLFLMAIPGIIYFFCFAYMPIYGLVLSFKNFMPKRGILGSPWVGMKNFQFMFKNATFWQTLNNTLTYNLTFLVTNTLCPLALSIALNEVRSKKLARIYQTTMIMPHFVSYMVISVVVFALLSADSGVISHWMKNQGLKPISFYTEAKYWPWILNLTYIWKHIGYTSIIYLGTITGISEEYYEAALIDGATKWQQIVHITLPFLKPMIVILSIMKIGSLFSTNFDLFYQVPLNSGRLYSVTNTIDVFVYNTLRDSNNVSLSTAVSFVQSVAGFVLVVITNQIVRWADSELSMF